MGVDLAYPVIIPIRDVQIPRGIEGKTVGRVELGLVGGPVRKAAFSACEGGDFARLVEFSYPIVPCIGDVQVPCAIEGDTLWTIELGLACRPVRKAFESASGDRGDIASRVDLAYPVVLLIGEIQAPCLVQSHPSRLEKTRRLHGTIAPRRLTSDHFDDRGKIAASMQADVLERTGLAALTAVFWVGLQADTRTLAATLSFRAVGRLACSIVAVLRGGARLIAGRTVQGISLEIDAKLATAGLFCGARIDTKAPIAPLPTRTEPITASAVPQVGLRIDTLFAAPQASGSAAAKPSFATLIHAASLSTLSAVQDVGLGVDTAAKAGRRRRRWTGGDTASAGTKLPACTRDPAASAVLAVALKIRTPTVADRRGGRTGTTALKTTLSISAGGTA